MGLIRLVAPAIEPVTVPGVIKHLRIDTSNAPLDDVVITAVAPGALTGDTTVPVTPLTVALAPGDLLPFDTNKVVVVAAAAAVDDEEITVEELPFDLDAGAEATIPADSELLDMIVDAREYVEGFTNRALISQQWRLTLDGFPPHYFQTAAPYLELASGLRHPELLDLHRDIIRLPKPPLITVDAIRYIDENGDTQTLDPALYQVNTTTVFGEISRAFGASWPSVRYQQNAVMVDFTCGYGATAATVPSLARRAIRTLAGHYYMNREVFLDSRFALEIPHGIDDILWQLRVEEAA